MRDTINTNMTIDNSEKPKSKHRKSTCAGCRRRKSKCDGKTPKCTTCIAYKDDCQYDKPPSLAYVRSLEQEIQELKTQVRQTKAQIWLSRADTQVETKFHPASPASDTGLSHDSNQALPYRSRQIKWDANISVGQNGEVSFHNSTSPFHESAENRQHPSTTRLSSSSNVSEAQRVRRDLIFNATHQRQSEPIAIANGATKANIPNEISHELFRYYWCWQHPLFLFVYRPAFTRGMSVLDPRTIEVQNSSYFSETLLKVTLAQSSRFLNHDVYDDYHSCLNEHSHVADSLSVGDQMQRMVEEARFGLCVDILRDSSIPTIQALLQQSEREFVFGQPSQAWTLAGVAFRMALGMGLHLPSAKLQAVANRLTAEDIEIRKRLFWSCYTWDKILSLYLGRMPGFTHATDDIPPSFMDDYSDSELWSPYYGEIPPPQLANKSHYPPCPGYVVSTFQQLCKLCIILNDIMYNIYSSEASLEQEVYIDQQLSESRLGLQTSFTRLSHNLRDWFTSLPTHLRIELDQMPSVAPPAHIISLNLLYHTTIILLHRPQFLEAPDVSSPGPVHSWQLCVQATSGIHDLMVLHANTFGLTHISCLSTYCVHAAANIALIRFEREHKLGEELLVTARQVGLKFLLDVLQTASSSMPALQRSNAIIRRRLQNILNHQKTPHTNIRRSYSSTPPDTKLNVPISTSYQHDFVPSTTFTVLPSGSPSYAYSQPGTPKSFVAPIPWQSNHGGNPNVTEFAASAGPNKDYIPSYPNQQFSMKGSENSYGGGEVDPRTQSTMLEYTVDPYTRLTPGSIDWNVMDHAFDNGGQSVHM